MCCHLVSLSVWPVFWMWSQWKQVLLWTPRDPTVAVLFKIKQAQTTTNQPTYHLHIMLHILFYQVHLQKAWVTHHFNRASLAHVRPLLPSPSLFHPRRGFIFQFSAIHQQPSSHTNASYFHCNLSTSFLWGFARAGRLFGFRKEKTRQLPKAIGGWETMARPVWFSLVLEPQTSS